MKDLEGRCVLPGFIEPHLHLLLTALAKGYLVNFSPVQVETLEAAKKLVMEKVANVKDEKAWVAGYGWNPSRVEGHSDLNIDLLDKWSETIINGKQVHIPIFVDNLSGHLAYVNTEALNRAGIPPNTTDPDFIRKDSKLTGVVVEAGIVKVAAPVQLGAVAVRSIKYWADGSAQGVTAAINELYINNMNPKGHPCGDLNYPLDKTTGKTRLEDLMSKWPSKGRQLLVHSNGDRATDQALDCYNTVLYEDNNKSMTHRIEQFTVVSLNQVNRAAKLGLRISHTIGHVCYWGQKFIDSVLGADRAMRIDPVHDDDNNELSYSFHSDSPVTDVNPLLYVKTAITRLMYPNGNILGVKQCVGLKTALEGVTINAARQVHLGDEIGSLEVGKNADLVILAEGLTTTKHEDIDNVNVVGAWLEGREVWSLWQGEDGKA